MKNFIKTFSLFLAFGLVGEVYADKWHYVDRPNFMDHPIEVVCERDPAYVRYQNWLCGLGDPGQERVLIDGTRGRRVVTQDTHQLVECRGGYCEIVGGQRRGEYVGQSDRYIAITMPTNYYIWEKGNRGDIILYKRGTGPAADHFPAWYIANEDVFPERWSDEWFLWIIDKYDVVYLGCDNNGCAMHIAEDGVVVDWLAIEQEHYEFIKDNL